MTAHLCICGAGYLAYIAMLLLLPLRMKKRLALAGGKVLALAGQVSRTYIAVLIVAPLLVTFVMLHGMGPLMDLVFCLCAVLAVYIAQSEALCRKNSGVYQKALVADGKMHFLSDIEALPTLAWEESPDNTLEILSKDGNSVRIAFADKEERRAAVEAMLSLQARLKP